MNYNEIMELSKWLEKSSFTTYSLNTASVSLNISKGQPLPMPNFEQSSKSLFTNPTQVMATQDVPTSIHENGSTENVEKQAEGHFVKSPIVGIYYESSNPGGPAFVNVGERVSKGDVLCILEAMKVMNEITADTDGVVAEVYASNGDMVEACMPLFRIEV